MTSASGTPGGSQIISSIKSDSVSFCQLVSYANYIKSREEEATSGVPNVINNVPLGCESRQVALLRNGRAGREQRILSW